MPGNKRGSLTDIKDALVASAVECKDGGVHYKVAIHVVTSLGQIIEKGVEHGGYELSVDESGS